MAEENELTDWFDAVSGPDWLWYVKFLAANDTYAKKNVHQGGPYVAKEVLRVLFPRLCARAESEKNPDVFFDAVVDSHFGYSTALRLVWYNSKRLGQSNGRDEARLTQWGGIDVPVVSAESTGSLVVFAYHRAQGRDADGVKVWVARNPEEEDRILDRVGTVEPGVGLVLASSGVVLSGVVGIADRPCTFTADTLPKEWKDEFPSGEELVARVISTLPQVRRKIEDERLMKRRACEFEMFRSIEEYHVLPKLKTPFSTLDAFLEFAHSVTNRRKSRSGRSLELQLMNIFDEENLSYAHGMYTEGRRKPDFVFPSQEKYWDGEWPKEGLRMLGAKTTVKDRWRQIINEARRVETKHLLTLQEGVSGEQFAEMHEEGIVLVSPESLHSSYPELVRPQLHSLSNFISETRVACG